jgi:hypothetical protein
VQKDLPPELKTKLRHALLDVASAAPEAYQNMSGKNFFERYHTPFVPATDATYQPVRALTRLRRATPDRGAIISYERIGPRKRPGVRPAKCFAEPFRRPGVPMPR